MLSIIIVNYKSLALVDDCISSIKKYNPQLPYEILIVDNSGDNAQQLLNKFPGVQWLSMGYNAGFARANNRGIAAAKGGVVLLLNPDVLFTDDSLSHCYQRFSASQYIACGIQLLNPDGSPQVSGSYFIKGGLNHLLPIPFLGNVFKTLGTAAGVKKTSIKNADAMMEVDWINGAFLMAKKEAIEKAGLLDEDFFLYAEEIEWCSRLRRVGKLCVYGHHHAIHLQGEAANEAFGSEGKGYYNLFDKKGRQLMLSNFVRIRKQFGVLWFLVHLFFYLLAIPVFWIGVLFQKTFSVKKAYHFTQVLGYTKNLFYLLGKSSHIIRNKPYFYKAL